MLGIADEFEKRGLSDLRPVEKGGRDRRRARSSPSSSWSATRSRPAGSRSPTPSTRPGRSSRSGEFGFPVVIKADGLAAGKGVVVCHGRKKAEEAAADDAWSRRQFGEAGRRIVIEEFLRGREVSFIVIADGTRVQPLVTAMDHKAAYDGDEGPNTGGMGAISPSPFMTEKLFDEVMNGDHPSDRHPHARGGPEVQRASSTPA